jgi:hypothetical protein
MALDRADLRAAARIENARIIARRADYGGCMALVEAFYEKVVSSR